MDLPDAEGTPAAPASDASRDDPLFVRSIEKAFRVLSAFGSGRFTLSLTQVAAAARLDKSAAQRFTHTLERLGYLCKNPDSKRFELTTRTLDFGHSYMRASAVVDRATPYLLGISRETEESVSLTVLDDTEIVYLTRFMSRHMVSSNVFTGTRLPAYCTAPGIAMLSRLPAAQARDVLDRSDLRPYTAGTTWRLPDLLAKIGQAAASGYAVAVEEIYPSDISIGAAILGPGGEVAGAVSLSVSRLRITPDEAVRRYAPLVATAAHAASSPGVAPRAAALPAS